jgi:hypothetical protein
MCTCCFPVLKRHALCVRSDGDTRHGRCHSLGVFLSCPKTKKFERGECPRDLARPEHLVAPRQSRRLANRCSRFSSIKCQLHAARPSGQRPRQGALLVALPQRRLNPNLKASPPLGERRLLPLQRLLPRRLHAVLMQTLTLMRTVAVLQAAGGATPASRAAWVVAPLPGRRSLAPPLPPLRQRRPRRRPLHRPLLLLQHTQLQAVCEAGLPPRNRPCCRRSTTLT